jgi:hypothetical protein
MRYLALLILCLSCGDTKFRKVEELRSLRILGIQADAPEVSPGTAVNLRLLVSDVNGTAGTLTGTYVTCIDPGISQGARVNCDHDPTATPAAVSVDMTALLPSASGRTGLSNETFVVNIPAANVIFAGRDASVQANGVSYIALFTVGEETAFKRILVSTRTAGDAANRPNENPTGSTLSLNGGAAALPSKGDDLAVTTSAPQAYRQIRVDGVTESRTERYEVAWYASEGEFDKPKARIDEESEFTGDSPPSLVMAVIRDERGGIDFVKFPL